MCATKRKCWNVCMRTAYSKRRRQSAVEQRDKRQIENLKFSVNSFTVEYSGICCSWCIIITKLLNKIKCEKPAQEDQQLTTHNKHQFFCIWNCVNSIKQPQYCLHIHSRLGLNDSKSSETSFRCSFECSKEVQVNCKQHKKKIPTDPVSSVLGVESQL